MVYLKIPDIILQYYVGFFLNVFTNRGRIELSLKTHDARRRYSFSLQSRMILWSSKVWFNFFFAETDIWYLIKLKRKVAKCNIYCFFHVNFISQWNENVKYKCIYVKNVILSRFKGCLYIRKFNFVSRSRKKIHMLTTPIAKAA